MCPITAHSRCHHRFLYRRRDRFRCAEPDRNERNIQIEYSYTPLYGSYYIEGINHLYEFDCGKQSGWMYKVNGWFPNYGCSSYKLEGGETIVWAYTCKGLGTDIGAPSMG